MTTNTKMEGLKIDGHTIQHDASGQGHAWKNIPSDDVPASIQEELAGEIMDGGRIGEMIIAGGEHYRAL